MRTRRGGSVISLFIAALVLFMLSSVVFAQTGDYSLTPAGHIGGEVNCGLVVDNYVYLSQGGYLTVLEDNPGAFRQVATLLLKHTGIQFAISGNYLFSYELGTDSTLQVIDISDPLHPADVSFLTVPAHNEGNVSVSGQFLAIAAVDSGLWVVDISDPANPQVVGNLRTLTPEDVAVSGNYVFATEAGNGKVQVVDVSNPAAPTLVATVDLPRPEAIAVQGNYAYVAVNSYPNIGLQILDVSDPLHPASMGFVKSSFTEGNTTYLKNPKRVAVEGNRAYLACNGGGNFLLSFDVSDPANPGVLGHLQLIGDGQLRSFQVANNTVYLTYRMSNLGLESVDVSDPANPVAQNVFERPWTVDDVIFVGDTLLVEGQNQLWGYDVSDPAIPVQREADSGWSGLTHMQRINGNLIAIKNNQIVLLDISHLNAIQRLGSYQPATGKPDELFVRASFAYLLVDDATDRLEIVDISNPNSPNLVGNTNLSGEGRALWVSANGSLAFAAYYQNDSNQGFQVFDLSNPANPTLLSTTQTVKRPLALAASDSVVFVGSNSGLLGDAIWVLEKFDITNPAAPVKTVETGGRGSIWGMELVEDVVLAGIQGGSVEMFSASVLEGVDVCHSHGTIQITTGPVKTTTTGEKTALVATKDGDGNHKYKMGYGYQGVPLQTVTVPQKNRAKITVTQEFVAPLPPNFTGNFVPQHTCMTNPTGTVFCQPGSQVTLTAVDLQPACESYGWNFYEWQGCSSSYLKVVTLQCQNGCQETAVWHLPLLGVGNEGQPMRGCLSEAAGKEKKLLSFTIGASELSGWAVTSISAHVNGSEDYKNEIDKVLLYWNGVKVGEKAYPGHGNTIEFPVNISVDAGKTESLSISYKFNSNLSQCPVCEDGASNCAEYFEYSVSVSQTGVMGSPTQYARGKVIGAAMGSIELGCILNVAESKFYKSIQDAVDEASEGDVIQICPGTYVENVTVDKALTIKSSAGASVTTVEAKESNKDVFEIKKDKTTIQGLTISKASNKAGIGIEKKLVRGKQDMVALTQSDGISNCEIVDNILKDNKHGLSFSEVNQIEIRGNQFANNSEAGIYFKNSRECEIDGNQFEGNGDGLYLENCDSLKLINNEKISGNKGQGVHAVKCRHLEIIGNQILDNQENGILLEEETAYCRIGGSSDDEINLISGNKKAGIKINGKGSVKNKIIKNTIGLSKNLKEKKPNFYGIWLSDGATGNFIGERSLLENKGNIISGNTWAGIRIDGTETKRDTIWGNIIGTNPDGDKGLGNNTEGIELTDDTGYHFIENNVISGNTESGIRIKASDHNLIFLNIIGLKPSCSKPLANKIGIYLDGGAKFNQIGDTLQINVISGNDSTGIRIAEKSTQNNKVVNNYIGDNLGKNKWPNLYYGIEINSAVKNLIERNKIYTEYTSVGVYLSHAEENKILKNAIHWGEKKGLLLNWSKKNKISDNNFDNSGICLNYCSDNYFSENTIEYINSSEFKHSKRDTLFQNEFQGGGLLFDSSEDCIVEENTISKSYGAGMEISQSRNIKIDQNNIRENDPIGIHVVRSKHIEIANNRISRNPYYNLYLENSFDVFVHDNEIDSSFTFKPGAPLDVGKGIWITNDHLTSQNLKNFDEQRATNILMVNYHPKIIIKDNSIEKNKFGIVLTHSQAHIIHNKIISNFKNAISGKFYNNGKIIGNTIQANRSEGVIANGICLEQTKNALIADNYVHKVVVGVYLLFNTENNQIKGNKIISNTIGLMFYHSKANFIANNQIISNCTGVKEENSKGNRLVNNTIRDSWCPFTGISLDNSSPTIEGNVIEGGKGSGIRCQNGSAPVISKNNIFDNGGFAVLNSDTSVRVYAQGNWWGDGTGPGGAGPGSGDEVSGPVDFGSWRTSPVTLIVSAGRDTVFAPIGKSDSVLFSVQNWNNPEDVVKATAFMNFSDWLVQPNEWTLSLHDSVGADTSIRLQIPATTPVGTKKWVKITATSQTDPSLVDVDSFLIVAYNSVLTAVRILPERALLRLGQSQSFRADGYDSLGNPVEIHVNWSCTGGVIDSSGWFTAGADTGVFTIVAKDRMSGIQGQAMVHIFPQLARIQVSPDTAYVKPGGKQQFTVSGFDTSGAETPVFARWEATGGTIDRKGLYSAGSDTGFYYVTAEDSLSGIAGTAVVWISKITKIDEKNTKPPAQFALFQNYPNPFNPETTIRFDVAKSCHVQLTLYDLQGRVVKNLVDGEFSPGRYKVKIRATHLSSGLYLYTIKMGNFRAVKKMVILK